MRETLPLLLNLNSTIGNAKESFRGWVKLRMYDQS